MQGSEAARTWATAEADGKLRCELCPRHCRLNDGQRGFCYVRKRTADSIVLDSYGRASGFIVDPIEKKPLNHFFPGSAVLSFGTAGCNLGCRFCQNWDISKARKDDRLTDVAGPEHIARAAAASGCKSIAFTYNDPVVFAEYAIDTAHAAREASICSVAVTAGYIGERAREAFFDAMDAVNVDLKGFTEEFYQKQCAGQLGPVLETLVYLAQRGRPWLEVTTLLIPGLNDSRSELERMTAWFAESLGANVPLHFTAFHPDHRMSERPPTPASTVLLARDIARQAGLRFVYTGNVASPETQTTRCPSCEHVLVGRDGYRITAWGLEAGRCAQCGLALPGHFGAQAGSWGPRRRRLDLVGVS